MFAFGFILALAVMLGVFHVLTLMMPASRRPYAWVTAVVLAVSLPYWHYAYPSYREFVALCARPDLYAVKKTVAVDYPYVDSSIFEAYRLVESRGFKGFDVKQGSLGYFRYTRGENWTSPACQRDCENPSVFEWEKTCEVACLTKTPIAAPEFELKSGYSTMVLTEGRLIRARSAALGPTGDELATGDRYVYYPYGNDTARILGMASGSAPTLSCEAKKSVWSLEFLQPRVSK